jgi:prepilin-type N-terminal cleavage/methylation domain-containing protein
MNKKAFTLIELLVSIVLFSLLLATAFYSFRFISLNMRNINNSNPKTVVYYSLLRNVIGSMYHYVELDETEKDKEKAYYHFFEGKKEECFFISNAPIYSSRLSMVHIFYKNNELWYEEGEVFKKNVNFLNLKKIPLHNKLMILKNLENVSFSYFMNHEKYETILREIPSLINLKITKQNRIILYSFAIKSDNNKHLEQIISDSKESF